MNALGFSGKHSDASGMTSKLTLLWLGSTSRRTTRTAVGDYKDLFVFKFDVAIRTAVRTETNCYTDFSPNNRHIGLLLCRKWRTTFSITGGISLNFGQRPKTDPF